MSTRKSIPDLSPLLAPNLVCRGCGQIIEPKVIKGFHGAVETLRYDHRNTEVGCSYRVDSTAMTPSGMVPLREDGSEVKL
jgi:hypothetical protein